MPDNNVNPNPEPTPEPVAPALSPEVQAAITEAVKAAFASQPVNPPAAVATGGAPTVIKGKKDADSTKTFLNYVRTGDPAAKAALQEGTASEGGVVVPEGFYSGIVAKRSELSIPRQMGAWVFQTNRDLFTIPAEDTALTKFSIVAEEGAISGAEEEPTFSGVQVTLYKFMKLIKVSTELLEDEDAGLEAYLQAAIGRALADTENYYSLVGSGSAQPQGAVVGGTLGKTTAGATAITAAEMINLKYSLPQPYRDDNACWVMNGSTEGYLRALSGNPFSFAPTPMATGNRRVETLDGFPVFNNSNMAAIATAQKTVLFGNWSYYGLVTNRSLTIRRLNELYAGNDQVGILARFRMGGKVIQSEAFRYMLQA